MILPLSKWKCVTLSMTHYRINNFVNFSEEKVKVITYCAEVISGYLGYLDIWTGEILFAQYRLLSLAHLYQLYQQSLFLAETKMDYSTLTINDTYVD